MAESKRSMTVEQSAAPEGSGAQKLSGTDAITQSLQSAGIEVVFGSMGGAAMHLVESVAHSPLKMLSARTELSSAWMSYGYNRIKRRAASVCLAHCVGAVHASPVAYAAKADSTPFFMIGFNLDSALDMREALQDAQDVYAVFKPLTKYIRRVVTPDDLPLAIRQSVVAASTGRAGASMIDLAAQVMHGSTSCRIEPLKLAEPPGAAERTLEEVLRLIKAAKSPVIVAGAGVAMAGGAEALQKFAEATGIPVVSTSWGGRGLLADDHPLYAGALGSFGWISANQTAQDADLWIAIGTTFSQMSTAAWSLRRPEQVIHVDIDAAQIGKLFEPTLGIVADARVVLEQLLGQAKAKGLKAADPNGPRLSALKVAKENWKQRAREIEQDEAKPLNQYSIIRKMSEELPEGTIVIGDSGGNAFMLYRAFQYRVSTPMAMGSRYMSLGCSLPAAIGAKLAAPERTVVSYHGDGGFYYDLAELSTLAEHNLKVIVIIDNNGALSANRSVQLLMGYKEVWVNLPRMDFAAMAQTFGVPAERVTEPEDIVPALRRALAAEGPYLIDMVTDPDMRMKRAVKDVIPLLSDRKPKTGPHWSPPLEESWPKR